PLQIKNIQQNGITPEDISKEINGYYSCFYTAFFLMACSVRIPLYSITDWHRSSISDSHPFDQPGT
ncbi:hypothetical protein AML92_26125, partial [Escherichia coli]